MLAALAAALAGLAGHAAAIEPDTARALVNDAIHILAAGLWVGGLWPLALLLRRAATAGGADARPYAVLTARRYSRWALGAVIALMATGAVNAYLLVGDVAGLFGTRYGHLLLLKLSLLAVILVLARREPAHLACARRRGRDGRPPRHATARPLRDGRGSARPWPARRRRGHGRHAACAPRGVDVAIRLSPLHRRAGRRSRQSGARSRRKPDRRAGGSGGPCLSRLAAPGAAGGSGRGPHCVRARARLASPGHRRVSPDLPAPSGSLHGHVHRHRLRALRGTLRNLPRSDGRRRRAGRPAPITAARGPPRARTRGITPPAISTGGSPKASRRRACRALPAG